MPAEKLAQWLTRRHFSEKAALLYGLAGLAWIVVTDPILEYFFAPGSTPVRYQVYKGWIFVTASALLFYIALLAAMQLLERTRKVVSVQEQRLAFHVNNSPLAVIEWDRDQRLCLWSKRAEQIFGWTSEEVFGKSWSDWTFVHEDDAARVESEIQEVITGRAARNVICNRNYRKDGLIIHCEWFISVMPDESGASQSILTQVQDVTERVLAEEKRFQLEAQVQHSQKLESLGVLAGGIAHDFNNLLVGILGNADLAMAELPQDAPAQDSLKELVLSAQHAAELCRQMLAYSGKGQFLVESVTLNDMVIESKNLIAASITKRARLHFALAPDLPSIDADVAQLRQVLMNLIINASDALGDEDGDIWLESDSTRIARGKLRNAVTDEELVPGEYVRLRIRDSGCGMDHETIQRIFDPFFSTKFTGRGLGLSAVLGIMRGHGGCITVKSAPGQGTTFTLYFPAGRCAPHNTPIPDSASDAWRGEGDVLVVDDEDTVRLVAQRTLERAGFQVYCAGNGQQAMEVVETHLDTLKFVLLDMTMPVMNGEQTLQAIRELSATLPVILTSGYSEEEMRVRFTNWDRAWFLQKPYRTQDLVGLARTCVESPGGESATLARPD